MKKIFIVSIILATGCASQPREEEIIPKEPDPVVVDYTIVDEIEDQENIVFEDTSAIQANEITTKLPNAKKIILFSTDSYQVSQEYHQDILVHARYLLENQNVMVRIEGHTDERGSREYNLALGENRAQSVARIFAQNGATNYETVSFGEERPVIETNDESGWRLNRRVELRFLNDN